MVDIKSLFENFETIVALIVAAFVMILGAIHGILPALGPAYTILIIIVTIALVTKAILSLLK